MVLRSPNLHGLQIPGSHHLDVPCLLSLGFGLQKLNRRFVFSSHQFRHLARPHRQASRCGQKHLDCRAGTQRG